MMRLERSNVNFVGVQIPLIIGVIEVFARVQVTLKLNRTIKEDKPAFNTIL